MASSACNKADHSNTGTRSPVSVTGNSIVFTPQEMEMNKYYLVELNGTPYLLSPC